ncbi:MAG: cardiolipin synthase [Lautropia sp.]
MPSAKSLRRDNTPCRYTSCKKRGTAPPVSLMLSFLSFLIFLVHVAAMARAITRPNRIPASRVAWVAVIVLLPVGGVIAYLLLGETSIGRKRVRALQRAWEQMSEPDDAAGKPAVIDQQARPLFDLASSVNRFKPVSGNRIRLIGDPAAGPAEPINDSNAVIDALIEDFGSAGEHIHISFYIWLDDRNGGRVADALAAAARRGVECRVMVDALGSRAFTRSPRWPQLRDAGVHLLATLDDIPRLSRLAVGRLDLRNHRKIVVIDNRIAWCGSQNCADPEFRVAAKYAPWIDIFLRCEGPVVRQLQSLFLSSWIAETGEPLQALPAAMPAPDRFEDDVVAQVFGTGPTTRDNAMSDIFVGAMFTARSELLITTPYFVPDEAILRALCAAPRRGVKTTLILPARNNSWLVGSACRSCYLDLLRSGVAVHEYTPGLLHTKSMTIDARYALVGSANMDRRSLQLNFENNLLIADLAATRAVRQRQLGYLSVSKTVVLEDVLGWPFHERLLQNAIGMMAPVL